MVEHIRRREGGKKRNNCDDRDSKIWPPISIKKRNLKNTRYSELYTNVVHREVRRRTILENGALYQNFFKVGVFSVSRRSDRARNEVSTSI